MCLQYHRLKVYEDDNNRIKVGYKMFRKQWSENTYTNLYYDTRKKYVLGDWNSIDNIEQKSVATVSPCYSRKETKYYAAGFHFYTKPVYKLFPYVCIECICEGILATGYEYHNYKDVSAFVAKSYRLMREV